MFPASIYNWNKDAKSVEFDNGTEVISKEFKKLQKENQYLEETLGFQKLLRSYWKSVRVN